jgi:putative DNA primase/helicase
MAEETIKAAFDSAEDPSTGALLHSEVKRLAELPPLEYDQVRKAEAKRLGVRVDTLDGEVNKAHKQHEAEHPKPPLQWAPASQICSEPVDGGELIAELIAVIRRFVLMSETDALIVALWILFTWVFEHVAETNPYLRIVSPAPECGKSTLLKVIKFLARIGWLVSRVTASSFSRTMEHERRTLLLDEGDAFLHENEVMRNLLDGASDPDTANISMSVKSGDDWTPANFNVFVPIAIASIGMLRKMQTVESRSIHVHLKRATPVELRQLAKGRQRELKSVLEPLAAKCARWAADNAGALKGARPEMPEGMTGREMDKWEPLIAIADSIGGDYAKDARSVCEAATDGSHVGDLLAEALLADLKLLFDSRSAKALASIDICRSLIELDDRPWAEMGKARKPLTQRGLAGLLRAFDIVPGTVQLDDKTTAKGYKRSDLEDAFSRYLPIFRDSIRQSVQPLGGIGEAGISQNVKADGFDGLKNGTPSHGEKDLDALTDQNRGTCAGDVFSDPDLDAERFDYSDEDPDRERFE